MTTRFLLNLHSTFQPKAQAAPVGKQQAFMVAVKVRYLGRQSKPESGSLVADAVAWPGSGQHLIDFKALSDCLQAVSDFS